MQVYTHSDAVDKLAEILDQIQALHSEAQSLSERFEIPFSITLEGGRELNTTAEYTPWSASEQTWESSSWNSSGC
jgi:hypothetical protein